MVDQDIVGDLVEPGDERLALPLKAMDGLPRVEKHLLRQVLSLSALPQANVEIAVHGLQVTVVECGERSEVAAAYSPINKGNDSRFIRHLTHGQGHRAELTYDWYSLGRRRRRRLDEIRKVRVPNQRRNALNLSVTTCDALVLVLEDDTVFRTLLLEVLQSEGLQVRACSNFEALRTAAGSTRVGLIVADCWGTSQSRLDCDERQQISELARQAPTILLTGRDWARGVYAADLSVAAILQKPIDLDSLMNAVWSHFRKTELAAPMRLEGREKL
jgi:ActR/RegA family two-component response regulator